MAAVSQQAKITAIPAYLDLAEPDLEAAARQLAEAGHADGVVVPLLFTEAFHATVDVPETVGDVAGSLRIRARRRRHSWVPAATSQTCSVKAWSRHASKINSSVLLFAVGSSRPAANEAVVDLAARLATGRRSPVRACFGTCSPGVADVLDELA